MTDIQNIEMKPIARIHNDFATKFGIPRQSGLAAETESEIIFEKEFAREEAVRELENFSHIWLLWLFSENLRETCSLTVRPPRLGGNKRIGVFATRSPFRPNPIGLSAVRLNRIEFSAQYGPILHVSGADLMNGTPILDIKPYLSFSDSYPDASGGFTEKTREHLLNVNFPNELLELIPPEKRTTLTEILSEDPRPSYQDDPQRLYGIIFGDRDVRFTVNGNELTVQEIADVIR